MKRVVAFAVLFSFAGVPLAHADERRFTPKTSISFATSAPVPAHPPAVPRLTKASIDKAVAAAVRGVSMPTMRRKSVLKRAWFWVVVGGAVAAIIIIANNGNDDGSGELDDE